MPYISVIVSFSRTLTELNNIINDFNNQTFKDFELIIVRDGSYPERIKTLINTYTKEYPFVRFEQVKKANDKITGTTPKNYGINVSKGKYCYFIDDDDRVKDTLLETLSKVTDNSIVVVQVARKRNRVYKNSSEDEFILIPEVGCPIPLQCHIDTSCFIVKKEWAQSVLWQNVADHDYVFIKNICEKYNPQIQVVYEMLVDKDNITKNIKDWVSYPPFYRKKIPI